MTDPKAPARKTIVESIKIHQVPFGETLFRLPPFEEGEEPEVVWEIVTTTRTGSLAAQRDFGYCISEEAANAYARKHPVGSELPVNEFFLDNPDLIRDMIGDPKDSELSVKFCFGVVAGDEESPLAFDTLKDAGLLTRSYELSQEVCDHLGRERISILKGRFGGNWEAAAVFEYCALNFSRTSPAFMAACYKYHHYISGDDFSAGYLWRDLEIMMHGVETQAMKSVEMRRKAGAMGSKASASARERRRTALMGAMEDVARRNPDVARLGESALAELALSQCIEAEPSLWRQGKGQVMEYLGEIRRGEAGQEMQARYDALLGKKPPRRLG